MLELLSFKEPYSKPCTFVNQCIFFLTLQLSMESFIFKSVTTHTQVHTHTERDQQLDAGVLALALAVY